MRQSSWSRRKLLAAIAAAGGASRLGPFLPAAVRAATAPKRILTIFHPMGYLESSFWPTGEGTSYQLGETMTALDPWRSKLLFLDGIVVYGPQYYFNFKDNEHGLGAAMAFTGGKYVYTGPGQPAGSDTASIDQAIASFQYAQVKTPFRSLNLGVNSPQGADSHTAVFYSKGMTPVIAQRDPKATFDQLFAGFTGPTAPPTSTPSTPTSPPVDYRKRQQQSVIDYLKRDLSTVRRLAGKDDQSRLDAHLEGIASLENRLKGASGGGGTGTTSGPTAPAGSVTEGCTKPTLSTAMSLENTVHSQMDLIAAAFACDMTRSASLQLAGPDGGIDAVPDVNQHDTTHKFGDTKGAAPHPDNHKRYDRWFAARWAYLLNRLDSIQEGNGTMLDNTLVVFSSDTTTGTNTAIDAFGAHVHYRFPLWMAGGGAFAFKTGQAIRLPVPHSRSGKENLATNWVAHHRVLTSICQAFGMNVDGYGGNDPGKGGVPQLVRA